MTVIGQRFGNYRAVSLLGEGGMGAVYLAEHPEIGRRVAIKVLRPELIRDPQLLVRFLNEARAANAIRHPNIIEILDSSTLADGTPYLVMELLEGEVLSARIRRLGRLPLADALEFSYQTASALAAAHGKGIIHRDLKPDNLFIISDGGEPPRERIKVLDFGIAKLQTLTSGSGMMQTRTGTMMGTPVYMSPEQCLGTKTVDHRSDLYALGVILFEMLAGHPPFTSEGFGELVNMHLNVRARSLREIDPGIPEPVAALVAKALEKVPDARQRSAAEMQADIRAAAGKSILIRGISSPDLASGTLQGVPAVGPRPFAGPTTLTTGTGERLSVPASEPPPVRRRGAARWVAAGVVIAGLVVGGAMVATSRRGASPEAAMPPSSSAPSPSPSRPSPSGPRAAATANPIPNPNLGQNLKPGANPSPSGSVRLTIASQPSGAAVTDIASGMALGPTPVAINRPGPGTAIKVRIEKSGFVAAVRAFDLDRDRTETVSLDPAPRDVGAVGKREQAEKPKKAKSHRPIARPEEEPAKL